MRIQPAPRDFCDLISNPITQPLLIDAAPRDQNRQPQDLKALPLLLPDKVVRCWHT
jgi:hypothetical protein